MITGRIWLLAGGASLAVTAAVSTWQWRDTHSKLATLRAGHAALTLSYQQASIDLDAERRNAADALAAQIEADRRAAELSIELDAARVAARESRVEIVTRTVEVIRNATSLSAVPIPDDVYAARLRQWCSADTRRTDDPHCDGAPGDERSAE